MDWVTQIFLFGFIALGFFILSRVFIGAKKPGVGLGFALLELLSASVSSWAWADALRGSGKGDWFLLGVLGYPPIGLIFWSMLVVGIWCTVVSIKGIKKQNAPATIAKA